MKQMLLRLLFWLGVTVTFEPLAASGQSNADASANSPAALAEDRYRTVLEPLLETIIRDHKMPGLAIGVVEGDRLVYARGFGVMKMGEASRPITPKTLFHMASITKTIVATGVMQLAEQGKLELDAPVVRFLPYFQLNDPRASTITLRQILTHRSGMPDVEDYEWDKPQYDDGALERYVRSLHGETLIGVPGEQFRYSNMAFEVLGDAVAKASGSSFEESARQSIFRPLGMLSTTLLLKEADPELLATGHTTQKDGTLRDVRHYPYNRTHTPSSNLHSNVEDMALWIRANLNGGVLDGQRILAETTLAEMWRPVTKLNEQVGVGLTWWTRQELGETIVFHSGADDGFRAHLALVPARKIGLVFMTNGESFPQTKIEVATLTVALGHKLDVKRFQK